MWNFFDGHSGVVLIKFSPPVKSFCGYNQSHYCLYPFLLPSLPFLIHAVINSSHLFTSVYEHVSNKIALSQLVYSLYNLLDPRG